MAAPLKGLQICKFCGKTSHHAGLKWTGRENNLKIFRASSSKSTKKWQSVVGLEVHAQIQADSKLFSGSSAKYGGVVNTQVAFLDAALPGTLPVVNRKCVEAGVKTALALGCRVNRISKFDRKHYFYADLPAGYQITQQRQPIANGGHVSFVVRRGGPKKGEAELKSVKLTQLQLEQDSGKSLHDDVEKISLIDLNRAGCGLMEIISEPQFTDGNDATAYVRELRKILQTVGTCDGKMSEGSLRVDANISVHRPGMPLGVRTEVKNLNSIRVIRKAIDYEIERQIRVLEAGGEVVNETRSFDIETDETVPMRDKEMKQDYRFMPEPNLPPLHLYTSDSVDITKSGEVVLIDKLREELPALPAELRESLMTKFDLTLHEADAIVTGGLLRYLEALAEGRDIKKLTKYLVEQFDLQMQQHVTDMSDCTIKPSAVGTLFDLMEQEELSVETTLKVLDELVVDADRDPIDLIDKNNWRQLNDEVELRRLCVLELESNPKAVAKYKQGKKKVLNSFIGGVKRATDNRGNPRMINKILQELLSK